MKGLLVVTAWRTSRLLATCPCCMPGIWAKPITLLLTLAGALICCPSGAFAYIGPGLGAGVIATVLGILSAFFLFLFAVLWYPIKRLARKVSQQVKKRQARREN